MVSLYAYSVYHYVHNIKTAPSSKNPASNNTTPLFSGTTPSIHLLAAPQPEQQELLLIQKMESNITQFQRTLQDLYPHYYHTCHYIIEVLHYIHTLLLFLLMSYVSSNFRVKIVRDPDALHDNIRPSL